MSYYIFALSVVALLVTASVAIVVALTCIPASRWWKLFFIVMAGLLGWLFLGQALIFMIRHEFDSTAREWTSLWAGALYLKFDVIRMASVVAMLIVGVLELLLPRKPGSAGGMHQRDA